MRDIEREAARAGLTPCNIRQTHLDHARCAQRHYARQNKPNHVEISLAIPNWAATVTAQTPRERHRETAAAQAHGCQASSVGVAGAARRSARGCILVFNQPVSGESVMRTV